VKRTALFMILGVTAMLVVGCDSGAPETATVRIREMLFVLDVAADPETREQGLMGVERIDESGGMIFVFPRASMQSFWMGHCLVDMDIIFLDPGRRITAMHEMKAVEPQRPGESDFQYRQRVPHYGSRYPAQYAIELKAGSLASFDPPLQTGEIIEFDSDALQRSVR
jgi:uncharacterized membrane protein (UPF0127 family)